MMRRKLFASISFVISAIAVMASVGSAYAATATAASDSANALKISPVRTDVDIAPGGTKTVDVYVQNLTKSEATLKAVVNDFVADKNETGQPALILDANQGNAAHGLKQFTSPIDNFTLQPNEQKDVKVTIKIPAKAAPGGYYGAVRFAPASTTGDKNVNLAASVASLVLVKVSGTTTEKMNIASFDVRNGNTAKSFFTSNKNINAVVRFQNTGNIQEEPFGKITLKKGTKVVATYEVNNTSPRGNVLPDSIRRFDIALSKVGSMGKYTVQGDFGYGSKGQLLTASKTFYVVPVGVIIAFVAVLLLIILAIFGLPRMVRKYNKRVIQKANKK